MLGLVKFGILPSLSILAYCSQRSMYVALVLLLSCIRQARARKGHPRFRIGAADPCIACFNKIITVRLYFLYDLHRSWPSHEGTVAGGAWGKCQARLRAEGDPEGGRGGRGEPFDGCADSGVSRPSQISTLSVHVQLSYCACAHVRIPTVILSLTSSFVG